MKLIVTEKNIAAKKLAEIVKAAKHETRTDWRRRPLSKRQIEYALSDARYLPPLRDKIHGRLKELGRLGWIEESRFDQFMATVRL